MVHSCIVRGCRSEWYPGCNLKFHLFPKNIKRREEWLSIVPIKKQFYESAKICSLHFRPTDYNCYKTGRTLTHSAIPYFGENSTTSGSDENESGSIFLTLSTATSHSDKGQYEANDKNEECGVPRDEPKQGKGESLVTNCQKHLHDTDIVTDVNTVVPIINCTSTQSSYDKVADEITPRVCKEKGIQVKLTSNREKMLLKHNKMLDEKIKKQKKYIAHMKSLLAIVKNYTTRSEIENIITGNFADLRKLFNKSYAQSPRYCNEVKDFALTIQIYSPKAYEFLRSFVALPRADTLKR